MRMYAGALLVAVFLLAAPRYALGDSHWNPTRGQLVILSMTTSQTLDALGKVARGVDEARSCREKSYRRLGLDKQDGDLIYILRCASGDEFVIRVKRDARGSTGVMSCALLKLVADVDCRELRREHYIDPR